MKHWINHLGMQRKLMLTVVLLLVVSLSMTAVLFSFYDRQANQVDFVSRLEAVADVVANRSSAAVAFDDKNNALENLMSLSLESNVRYACIYKFAEFVDFAHLNKVVAEVTFGKESLHQCDVQQQNNQTQMKGKVVRVHRNILHANRLQGALIIYADFNRINERFIRIISAILLSGLVGVFFAYIILIGLQKWITGPILSLSQVMIEIKRNRDFSRRAFKFGDDEVGTLVDGFNDMLSQIEEDQRLLEEMAYIDSLTGLPNRRMFKEQLARAFAHSRAHNTNISLIFIDLDNFKWVNDTKGHDMGDLLLQEIASRLQKATEGKGIVCRLGGDEFTVIADAYLHHTSIMELAKIIQAEVAGQVELSDFCYKIGLSLGLATGTYKTDNHITLMKKADIAVYQAKNAGKNTIRSYDQFGHSDPDSAT